MTHQGGGASGPMWLLLDVEQFPFFIEYRLRECEAPTAPRSEALPSVPAGR
jgi:hypothetical protein